MTIASGNGYRLTASKGDGTSAYERLAIRARFMHERGSADISTPRASVINFGRVFVRRSGELPDAALPVFSCFDLALNDDVFRFIRRMNDPVLFILPKDLKNARLFVNGELANVPIFYLVF